MPNILYILAIKIIFIFILEFKPLIQDEKKKVPHKIWTIDLIRKEVPECPDNLAKRIFDLPEIDRESRVMALKKIEKLAGVFTSSVLKDVFDALKNYWVGNQFKINPNNFVEIAKIARNKSAAVFNSFCI